MNYIIISPVRNEAEYIKETLVSVVNQSVLPREWIIVNDGSTDKTLSIIEPFCRVYPWIRVVSRKDRGFTNVGAGVMEAFNDGLKNIKCNDWQYLVKLDCDLRFDTNYFNKLMEAFLANKKLGIIGPTSFVLENMRLVEEKMPLFHPCAASRMYRRECFDQIGGLVETLGWDTIDLLRAQIKGWETRRLQVRIIHLRRMSSRKGLWEGKLRTGRNFYITGYHPLFLIARCIYRLFQKPYLIESIGVFCGYLRAGIKREVLVVSAEEITFFHKQQMRRLFGAKE